MGGGGVCFHIVVFLLLRVDFRHVILGILHAKDTTLFWSIAIGHVLQKYCFDMAGVTMLLLQWCFAHYCFEGSLQMGLRQLSRRFPQVLFKNNVFQWQRLEDLLALASEPTAPSKEAST